MATKPENPRMPGQSTRSIHGSASKDPLGSPHTPVYNTTTFAFDSTEDLLEVVEGREKGGLYTRFGTNPSIFSVEETMAAVEGAQAAMAFCSGMAAETSLFTQFGRDGIVCVGDIYGGTYELLAKQLPLLGIHTTFLLGSEVTGLESVLQDTGAKLVFFETPTNPGLDIFDMAEIAEIAHRNGALVAVDNTFASPINQRPLEFGVDLVVYSATKFLGGHSDLTAGFVVGDTSLVEQVRDWRKNFGSAIAPEVAALLSRSFKTLAVRVRAQNESAMKIARAMEQNPGVTRVFYPGLESSPGHELARKQMDGFGGIVTIEVNGDGEDAAKVADALEVFSLAVSLGGTESLVTQPMMVTHRGVGAKERARRGITDSMLRLAIGLEDSEDLIADLEQALATMGERVADPR